MTMPDVPCRRSFRRWSGSAAVCLLLLAATRSAPAQTRQAGSPPAPVVVRVDPRVELLSIIFRLAGSPEYSRGRIASYVDEVEKHFGRFRDHPAVQSAAKLRRTRGVSYDACMSMAVHLSDAYAPNVDLASDRLPENLDSRWGVEGARAFVEDARQFVEDTSFREFFDAHRSLYKTAESRMQRVLDAHAHLEWFDNFFGRRPQATFHLVLGMLNGGGSYGPRYGAPDGREELYCILGVWRTDREGLPVFEPSMLATVVHEFCHSYTNAIVDRHEAQLAPAGKKMFPYVEAAMQRQGYGNWKTMMYESLVRACVVRYTHAHAGPEAARRAIAEEQARKFAWIDQLSELLGEYEAHRGEYADLDAFFPRVVDFFRLYADRFVEDQKRREAHWASQFGELGQKLVEQIAAAAARPKVVSIAPANGAVDVDPKTERIRVVFDRPMAAGSWSMVGGGANFPEIVGQPSYDDTRTIWTVSVKLKPAWTYRFLLNSDRFTAFRSQEGVPLAPVAVTFQTGDGKPQHGAASPSGT